MRHKMNEQYKGLGLEAFFDMVTELAFKKFKNESLDPGQALEMFCDLFTIESFA